MDICTEEGSTLMHAAAAVGSLTCLEELFARGLGLEMTASNDNTPLHIACLNDRISCVKSLVALGADVTAAAYTSVLKRRMLTLLGYSVIFMRPWKFKIETAGPLCIVVVARETMQKC